MRVLFSLKKISGLELRESEPGVKEDQQEPCPGASDANPTHAKSTRSDPLEVLESVRIIKTLESPISTIKGVFKDSKEEELSFDKEELRRAEEQLRVAFIEFYQKPRLLKHYR